MSSTPHSHGSPTPTSTPPLAQPSSSYLSYPVSHVVSSLYRRLTDSALPPNPRTTPSTNNGLYTPPRRTASPFQPPPLTPLSLRGFDSRTSTPILSRTLAEEIRLLLPPRLQLAESWVLAYSLEQDGVSLGTLYHKCASPNLPLQSSFVLVVRDAAGGIFGAYLTSAPHPSATFYGTGECFLWRASLIPSSSLLSISLPPPPSAPTDANLPRSTTLASPTTSSFQPQFSHQLSPTSSAKSGSTTNVASSAGTSSPDRIRFQAFPYSGVNDYVIFCETEFLSVGGGDGRYGLWLDEVLERGVSSSCLTFGNEPLSEEGEKFEVVGVEMWCVGSSQGEVKEIYFEN